MKTLYWIKTAGERGLSFEPTIEGAKHLAENFVRKYGGADIGTVIIDETSWKTLFQLVPRIDYITKEGEQDG